MLCPRSLHGPGAWYKVPIGGGNRDTAKTAARFACQRTPTKKCEGTMKLRARYLLSAVAALALDGGIAAADAAEMRMGLALAPSRSEESRGGTECVRPCVSKGAPHTLT